jgi:hypothetical protein
VNSPEIHEIRLSGFTGEDYCETMIRAGDDSSFSIEAFTMDARFQTGACGITGTLEAVGKCADARRVLRQAQDKLT